jgi:hypothetical protein
LVSKRHKLVEEKSALGRQAVKPITDQKPWKGRPSANPSPIQESAIGAR